MLSEYMLESARKLAEREILDEQFRAAVEAEKERLRKQAKSPWQRLMNKLPFFHRKHR